MCLCAIKFIYFRLLQLTLTNRGTSLVRTFFPKSFVLTVFSGSNTQFSHVEHNFLFSRAKREYFIAFFLRLVYIAKIYVF